MKQTVRPFLEEFLKLRFPARFVNDEQISEIPKAIKDAGVDDRLHSSAGSLIALNDSSRPYMHGGADNPYPDELLPPGKKLIRVVCTY